MRKMLAETSCSLSNTRNSQHLLNRSFAKASRLRFLLHGGSELDAAVQPGVLLRKCCN